MEHNVEVSWLLDFYGSLLTEKQILAMNMHFNDDMSLTEIGEKMSISRQAVHDILSRAEEKLLHMERKLGLLSRYIKVGDSLRKCLEACQSGEDIESITTLLQQTMSYWEE